MRFLVPHPHRKVKFAATQNQGAAFEQRAALWVDEVSQCNEVFREGKQVTLVDQQLFKLQQVPQRRLILCVQQTQLAQRSQC